MLESDRELILKIKSGDVLAFEVLVKRYQRPLYSFVNKIVKDDSQSDDVVQETFFKIYKSIERIDIDRKFSTYAFEIAKNTAISYLRSLKKYISIDQIEIEFEDTSFDKLIADSQKEKVKKALLNLPQKYQEVIRLYYFSDLSYKEIGKKLGLPVNTVRTHLSRAKKSLKDVLNE